jgi:large subunit ribosomal protein L21
MSFVTKIGSKQYIVNYNQKFAVDRLNELKEGDNVDLPILFSFGEDSKLKNLKAKVLSHTKGKKIRVVKFKSKSNYHRQYGFRASITILQIISEINTDKEEKPKISKNTTVSEKINKI